MSPLVGRATDGATEKGTTANRPTVAGILRRHTAQYVRQYPSQAAPQVQNILARLSLCRTRALGGHLYHCRSCNSNTNIYNSCADRHCPQCSGARRRDWLDASSKKILPGINYFQVVFTLPQQLSALTLGNRSKMYGLLMRSAWNALNKQLRSEFGIEPAALLVLHTWDQRLGNHPHVHALVPGGGPASNGCHWIKTRHRKHRRRKKPYLTDNIELGKAFRREFIAGLKRLHAKGQLKLDGDWSHLQDASTFEDWADSVVPAGWNVFIESPPVEDSAPQNVLKYLARYMSGGPISDRRIISHDRGVVKFWARSKQKPAPGEKPQRVVEELPGVEFTRRWAMHILPKNFIKSRNYGGFANTKCAKYLKLCGELLDIKPYEQPDSEQPADQPAAEPEPDQPLEIQRPLPGCPQCGNPMEPKRITERPGWSVVMNGIHRPPWY